MIDFSVQDFGDLEAFVVSGHRAPRMKVGRVQGSGSPLCSAEVCLLQQLSWTSTLHLLSTAGHDIAAHTGEVCAAIWKGEPGGGAADRDHCHCAVQCACRPQHHVG